MSKIPPVTVSTKADSTLATSFSFQNLQFQERKLFRFSLNPHIDIDDNKSDDQSSSSSKISSSPVTQYRMWMEDKTTKKQWEALVSEDLSEYGPTGVPTKAVFDFLARRHWCMDHL